MNTVSEMREAIHASLARKGFRSPMMGHMLTAMAIQESATEGDGAGDRRLSALAAGHSNFFGIKATPGRGVFFGGNKFENSGQWYRNYVAEGRVKKRSPVDLCVESALYLVFKSKHYANAREVAWNGAWRMRNLGLPEELARTEWSRQWIISASHVWCPVNKNHAPYVLMLFVDEINLAQRKREV